MISFCVRWFIAFTFVMLSAGCGTLMPTPDKPYTLGNGISTINANNITWRWLDARATPAQDNRATQDGIVFGEAVLRPAPYEFIQAEFARAVAAHEESQELLDKLRGKTIRLLALESSAGLRIRLSESQQGKWDVMRVRMTVDVDGRSYEAGDVHTFSNSDQPSPLSPAIQNAIKGLVNQIHLF
jgi:hypothetical protein